MMYYEEQAPTLLGFTEEEIGALPVKRRPLPPKKSAAAVSRGSGAYGAIKHNPTVGNAKKVLVQASRTAARAVKAAAKALRPSKPASTHLGATINPAAAKTPKQKQAVAKLQAAQKKASVKAQVAAAAGKVAHSKAVALAKKMADQHATASRLQVQKKGRTGIRGLTLLGVVEIGNTEIGEQVLDYLNEYYTLVGATPDPSNPGLLTDGSPDPAYADAADAGMSDAALDPSLMSDPLADAELPPPPPMDTHFSDMANVPGAIPYDGSRGTPEGFVGSLRLFTRETDIKDTVDTAGIDGTSHYGFVFGRYHDEGPEKGIPFGDKLAGGWHHVHGRYILGKFSAGAGSTGRDNGAEPVDPATAHSMSSRTANPKGVSYGPIVGNPAMADWKALRADDKGNLFWLPQEAPEWATFPLKQAAAVTAKAEKDAADAAAKADAAAAAKAQADAEAAQAQQDAANALAESQAASDQAIAQAQQDTQAQQMELDQAKFDQQQQTDAAQQAQLDMQQQRQLDEMLLAQARREQDYLAQHPDIEFAQGAGDRGQVDDYGDGGDDEQGVFMEDGEG